MRKAGRIEIGDNGARYGVSFRPMANEKEGGAHCAFFGATCNDVGF